MGSIAERIRVDDDYDRRDIMPHKNLELARASAEDAAQYSGMKGNSTSSSIPHLPQLGSTSGHSSLNNTTLNSGGGYRELFLSARGTLRKERRGLSAELLLHAADLNAQRKKRRRRGNQSSLFRADTLAGGGAAKTNLRQQIAARMGMAYLAPEELSPRVAHLRKLGQTENLVSRNDNEGRQYENSLVYSKFARHVNGSDKKSYVPKRKHSELRRLVQSMSPERMCRSPGGAAANAFLAALRSPIDGEDDNNHFSPHGDNTMPLHSMNPSATTSKGMVNAGEEVDRRTISGSVGGGSKKQERGGRNTTRKGYSTRRIVTTLANSIQAQGGNGN